MLQVKEISFSYPGNAQVLKNVSFELSKGDILCLLGPNGTGKTTLLRCLLGLRRPKSGRILMEGLEADRISTRQRAKILAYVPQSAGMVFPYSAEEVVMMGRVAHLAPGTSPGTKDREAVQHAMERLGVSDLSHRLFQEMSGGEKQMVLVARALAQSAEVLVMDEPTANLDYGNQVKMLQVVKALADEGYSILMTSHYPDHAFLVCNKVVMMKNGLILSRGTPEEAVTGEALTDLYNTPVRVTETNIDMGGHALKVCVPLML